MTILTPTTTLQKHPIPQTPNRARELSSPRHTYPRTVPRARLSREYNGQTPKHTTLWREHGSHPKVGNTSCMHCTCGEHEVVVGVRLRSLGTLGINAKTSEDCGARASRKSSRLKAQNREHQSWGRGTAMPESTWSHH